MSPIIVDPATPTWAARQVFLPIITLCAIWTKLSSLAPDLINVEPKVALSTVQFAPISTSSSIMTLPLWLTFRVFPFESKLKPKPSEPITELEWIIQFLPILVCLYIFTPGYIIQLSPISTLSHTYTCGWILTFSPILTSFSTIENLPRYKFDPYLTDESRDELESIPFFARFSPLKWSNKTENAIFGLSTLIRVDVIGCFSLNPLSTMIIEAFDLYTYSLYLGFPKKDNDLLSPFSIFESFVIVDFLSPSTIPPTRSATSWAFNFILAKI